jgi:hypothetical protein
MSLDTILEVESVEYELMNGLLRDNYKSFDPENGMYCAELVSYYIAHKPTVKDMDLLFVKHLTKVGTNILGSQLNIPLNLKKLYQFNMEAVHLPLLNSDNITDEQKILIHAHLYSHGANVAELIFRKEGNDIWAQRSFEASFMSGKLSAPFDPDYAFVRFVNAFRNLKKLGSYDDSEKLFELYGHMTEILEESDASDNVKATRLWQTAEMARFLFTRTNNPMFMIDSYDYLS